MNLSCCIWGLDFGKNGWMRFLRKRLNRVVSERVMLEAMAELGYRSIDIQPYMQRSSESVSTLKRLELDVACVSLSFFAPEGSTLHTKDKAAAQSMMDHLKDGIDHTAHIGVDRAYVVPGEVDDDLSINDYGVYYSKLAEYAQSRGVMIGIEHFPRKAFPTIQSTLEFIKEINHPNLYLLFDLGHAQISKEDPVQWLPEAGDRLLYVHLDDNDGINDLHLPLTEGVQTREDLESLFKVLGELNYQGPVSLELHPLLPNPFQGLSRNKQLVEELLLSHSVGR
ncbi:sugar phosphate isomerase/epimerase [Opitutales bacterium]|nr:sugar phosphate isomerase/epimerase [Opitutales bacterium]